MELFGIRLVGINSLTGYKLLLTLMFILALAILNYLARWIVSFILKNETFKRGRFWTKQGISLFIAIIGILGLASVWFDNPRNMTTAIGLVTAGLAFALQKVVTSISGYFVILRGKNFTVGDRISMGGVRGDVVALGFIQTTIMEMGQPPSVQSADPAMWVKSRQFTGRIVTVSNSKIFDEPIYNYTREFPYIWEELTLPIAYRDNRSLVEQILLNAARKHVIRADTLSPEALQNLQQQYGVHLHDLEPKVYWRLTDNWLEMTVRFLTQEHGIRNVKDAMSREIIEELDRAGIGIASATFELTRLPPVKLTNNPDSPEIK